ncbi:MAG: response regulator FixJ [Phycisphaerales bacterium]
MTEPGNPVVYIVDDDAAMRESLRFLVESVGLTAKAFASASDFLNSYKNESPCCAIIDVRMPGISGLDLQEQLNARSISIPVIIVTGHADVPMAVRAMKAGAFDFIEKPFNDQVLLERIQRAIDDHDREQSIQAEKESILERIRTLTPRETQVMEMVVDGNANKQIAANLGLSEKTIEVHRAHVMSKLGAGNAADLIRMVLTATR